MKLTKLFLLLASTSALVISSDRSVSAATKTANLAVSANVIQSCSIATTAVTFVNYDPTATSPNDSGQGTVTIACTQGVAPNIGLAFGQNAGGSTQRSMLQTAPGTKLLQYGLYQEAGRTTAWGDGTTGGGSVLTLTAVPDNSPITKQIYGRITALQNVPPDIYNDLVLASVNF
jgi:spore coat protein U-like protein